MAEERVGGRRERTALEWVLRIGVAGCFVGHGAFGIIGKEAWLPYFAVAGIGEDLAWSLMPLVGGLDIAVGVLALVSPRPAILGYMVFWAFWTALLRPLAGESAWETVERAGNYGVPLAFLVAVGASVEWRRVTGWLGRVRIEALEPERRTLLARVLRATTALVMIGHGALALEGKEILAGHLEAVGLSASLLPAMGWTEIALGLAVAVRPSRPLLLGILGWKLATEALYPLSGAPFWEFVERAGSYAAPLLLFFLMAGEARKRMPSSAARQARVWSGAVLALLVAAPLILSGEADPPPAQAQAPDLLERLRDGGFVLACRHAITDRSRGDQRPVDLEDRSTQRVLSSEGEEQARRWGRELRELGIPVGRVLAGQYARNADTGRLAFGRVETDPALNYGNSPEQRARRRELFSEPPAAGTNRVLVTHQGNLYRMMPEVERGSIGEGHCVVVEPAGGGEHRALERVEPGGWDRLG